MIKLLLVYFIFLSSILIFLSSGVIDSQDGFQYLAVARNIYYKGEPTTPSYSYNKRENIHMSIIEGKDGKTYSVTGLGFSLAFLPAVALTDTIYKFYNVKPSLDYFPLEADWLIFLLASSTNAILAALLGVVLFLYFLSFKISKKVSLLLSFSTIFATNLLVYSKHMFAHMMFVLFLVASAYLIRRFTLSGEKKFLFFSGLSFGIVLITYNQIFILSFISLILYYLIGVRFRLSVKKIRESAVDLSFFFFGLLPFIFIYLWFENLRSSGSLSVINAVPQYANSLKKSLPLTAFLEGIYGQIFSPGRSLFLYSPILLVPLIFWNKIKRNFSAELVLFLSLLILHILFFATLIANWRSDKGFETFWHGESSWGPRYLLTAVPFGAIVTGLIFVRLKRLEKILIFYPLLLIGFLINLLGILLPYQTKYNNLEQQFFLNGTSYHKVLYSNLLPRYSPLILQSYNLKHVLTWLPKTFDHGIYNVKFIDGIDFPFTVGNERWRTIEGKGYITFDNYQSQVKQFRLILINRPIDQTSTSSAQIQLYLNNQQLLEEPEILAVTERKILELPVRQEYLTNKDNLLVIDVSFETPDVLIKNKQILALIAFDINDRQVNLESIDVPYISNLGKPFTGKSYQNWGGTNEHSSSSNYDPWKSWHIHTQIYERLPDFWWVKNIYYWDIPKNIILSLAALNLTLIFISGYTLLKKINKLDARNKL